MKGHSDAASAKENECLKAQLRTVMCMATQNIASNNFEALIELQKESGCSSLKESSKGSECKIYKHHESVAEMEDSLASVVKEKIKKEINDSTFLGLIIDEPLNCTLDKKLIVYTRIERGGREETVFLGNYTTDNGTAACVFAKLVKVMAEWGIVNVQVAGLGSDGASVMKGYTTVSARS